MIAMGTSMMAAVRMKFFRFDILYPYWLITDASISDVAIFEISAGWNLTGPNSNQDRDPFTSTPRKITATSNATVARYIGREKLS